MKRRKEKENKTLDFAFGDIERKCLIVHPQLNTNPNVPVAATITAVIHIIYIYFRLLTVAYRALLLVARC